MVAVESNESTVTLSASFWKGSRPSYLNAFFVVASFSSFSFLSFWANDPTGGVPVRLLALLSPSARLVRPASPGLRVLEPRALANIDGGPNEVWVGAFCRD